MMALPSKKAVAKASGSSHWRGIGSLEESDVSCLGAGQLAPKAEVQGPTPVTFEGGGGPTQEEFLLGKGT